MSEPDPYTVERSVPSVATYKRIMAGIAAYIEAEVPRSSAHVSLIADGPARDLHAQFGFKVTGPDAVGMVMKL